MIYRSFSATSARIQQHVAKSKHEHKETGAGYWSLTLTGNTSGALLCSKHSRDVSSFVVVRCWSPSCQRRDITSCFLLALCRTLRDERRHDTSAVSSASALTRVKRAQRHAHSVRLLSITIIIDVPMETFSRLYINKSRVYNKTRIIGSLEEVYNIQYNFC